MSQLATDVQTYFLLLTTSVFIFHVSAEIQIRRMQGIKVVREIVLIKLSFILDPVE